ncbi:bifunctional adenosylcobinamide kinase/adenosylcobinamide-phosphate guanylyltransferase, partial [Thermodesulfobacteriota bacterium]
MKEVILVTGGCRSGKSRFALDYVNKHYKNKVFVATAEALDDEMKRRIQRHQEERGPDWKT